MRKIAGTRTIRTGLAASVLLTGAAAYGGSVLFVDDDAPSNGDGSTWKTAYRFLQDALANADGIEEIHVAQGTYRPDRSEANPQGSGDRGASFHLVNGLALQGGYAGIGADDPDARDIKVYETILSGDLLGDDGPDFANNDENSYQVVGGGGTNTTILDGFVITGGNGELFGGGMFIGSGSPMVVDCEFIENSAYEGGGLACQGPNSTPVISGCTFRGNTAGGGGGAIYILLDASPTITDCSFIENSSAGDAWWGGGAVYVWFAGVQLDRCTFVGNYSTTVGGAVFAGPGSVNLTNCSFVGNIAEDVAGAIGWTTTLPSMTNCTFHANSAPTGNAIGAFVWSGAPTGGLELPVTNCIFRDGGNEIGPSDGYEITYCNIEGGWKGEGNIDIDPLFVDPLGPDGIPGTIDDDLRLGPGSPAIDAADNTAVPKGITTDLDGNPRFVDDPCTDDTGLGNPPIVDMGAYEFQVTCPWDLDCSGDVGVKDLLFLLGTWGPCPPKGDCPADFDNSGDVGVKDLLFLLGAWGPCP